MIIIIYSFILILPQNSNCIFFLGIPLLGKTVWVKGEEWSGSLSTKPYWCNFYGVTCGGTVPGTASYVSVTSINLESCQMIGELPASIGDFRNLDFFSVGGNYVTGTIPETIGAWNKNMDSVKFFDNSIRGTIPAALGALTGLANLHLDQNYITGPIPFFLRELTKLKIMHLYDNSLTGPIPEWIGGLNSLTRIYWDSNYLTGTIPDSVGDLLSLEYLHLFSNSLVGSIPSSLEMLSNLTELSLYDNQLVGTIPSLAALSKLFLLDLHSNTLTMGGLDEVPSSLFSELTNEGPMNLSLNCLNYPARAFHPAPSCGIVPQPSLRKYTNTRTVHSCVTCVYSSSTFNLVCLTQCHFHHSTSPALSTTNNHTHSPLPLLPPQSPLISHQQLQAPPPPHTLHASPCSRSPLQCPQPPLCLSVPMASTPLCPLRSVRYV